MKTKVENEKAIISWKILKKFIFSIIKEGIL